MLHTFKTKIYKILKQKINNIQIIIFLFDFKYNYFNGIKEICDEVRKFIFLLIFKT